MIVLLDEGVEFYSEGFLAFFQKIHEATTRNFPRLTLPASPKFSLVAFISRCEMPRQHLIGMIIKVLYIVAISPFLWQLLFGHFQALLFDMLFSHR